MVKAIEQLVKEHENVKVLCAGDGPLLDDIREENVKIALRDTKVWEEVKEEFKSKNK